MRTLCPTESTGSLLIQCSRSSTGQSLDVTKQKPPDTGTSRISVTVKFGWYYSRKSKSIIRRDDRILLHGTFYKIGFGDSNNGRHPVFDIVRECRAAVVLCLTLLRNERDVEIHFICLLKKDALIRNTGRQSILHSMT